MQKRIKDSKFSLRIDSLNWYRTVSPVIADDGTNRRSDKLQPIIDVEDRARTNKRMIDF